MTPEEKRKGLHEVYGTMYKNRKGIPEMLNWMEAAGFLDAPASTKFHGCYPGGLADHSNNVYLRLLCLREVLGLSDQIPDDTLFVSGYLHDLCKIDFYAPTKKSVKNPLTKQWEDVDTYTINEGFPFGHGEKSAQIAQNFLSISAHEALAIRWHMGGYREGEIRSVIEVWKKMRDQGNVPLVLMTHLADSIATNVDESDIWPESCSAEHATISGWRVFRDKIPEIPEGTSNEEHYTLLFNHFLGKREGADKLLAYISGKQSDFFTAPADKMHFGSYPGGLCEQVLRMFYAMVWICDLLHFQTFHTNIKVDGHATAVKLRANLNIQSVTRIGRVVNEKIIPIEEYSQDKRADGAMMLSFDSPIEPGKYVVWYTPDENTLMEAIAAATLLNGVGRINTFEVEWRNKKREDGTWDKIPFFYKNEEIPWGSSGAKSSFICQPYMRIMRDESLALRWYEGPLDGDLDYPCNEGFSLSPLAFCAYVAFLLAAFTILPFGPEKKPQ